MDAFTERLRERWDRIAPTRAFARRNRRRGLPYVEPETSVDLSDTEVRGTSSTTYASTRDSFSFTTTAHPFLRNPYSTYYTPVYSFDLDSATSVSSSRLEPQDVSAVSSWLDLYREYVQAYDRTTISAEEYENIIRRVLGRSENNTPKSKPCKMSGDFDKIFEGET